MLITRIKEIKEFLYKDIQIIEICTKEQKDYIQQYQFSIIDGMDNDYVRIRWLVVLEGIINFEINNLLISKGIKYNVSSKEIKDEIECCINDYIKELENRREEIREVTNLIIPKEVKNRRFIKYHETNSK